MFKRFWRAKENFPVINQWSSDVAAKQTIAAALCHCLIVFEATLLLGSELLWFFLSFFCIATHGPG